MYPDVTVLPLIPTHNCKVRNLPSQCHMDSTRHPIHTSPTSPIPCNGLVYHNFPAHKLMAPHNQLQPSHNRIQSFLWSMSEVLAFQSGFSTVIAFLAEMGKIFWRSRTNLIDKVIELSISWLAVACLLKIFQIGSKLVKVLQILSFIMPKKIWHWLEMEILQWIWNQLLRWTWSILMNSSRNSGLSPGERGCLSYISA